MLMVSVPRRWLVGSVLAMVPLALGTTVATATVHAEDRVDGWHWYPWNTFEDDGYAFHLFDYSIDMKVYGYADPDNGKDDFQLQGYRFEDAAAYYDGGQVLESGWWSQIRIWNSDDLVIDWALSGLMVFIASIASAVPIV